MMLDASLSCAGLPAVSAPAGGGFGLPPFAVRTVVIEGDSITSNTPSTYADVFYSYRYRDSRPDLTIEIRAEHSRTVGTVLDDDDNTLMGNVEEDAAYQPDLVTALMGANDLGTGTAIDYKARLAIWRAAIRAARPGCRVAWSAPIPYNPDQSNVGYVNFTAQRAVLMADARDPAVWSQWADYYLPMAEHPDWFADPAITPSLWGDGVHPTGFDSEGGAGGQNRLYDQFKAAVDTIADASRTNATAPYEGVWPASEADLAVNAAIVRRFVVGGLAHTGIEGGVSVSGGGAQVRLNGAAYGADTGGTSEWLYNGDVIDLKLTTSSEHETAVTVSLTIGSETREVTFTTAADLAPVTYTHGRVVNVQPAGGVHTFGGLEFADGLAILAPKAGNASTSVVLTPSGGGAAINATRQFTQATAFTGTLEVWTAPITAGTYDVVITASAWRGQTTMSYGTVRNADPAPVQIVSSAPEYQSPPHLTPAVTVPANGLALVFLGEYGGADMVPATANSPTVLIDEGFGTYQSESHGVAIGSLSQSGQGSFDMAFGTYARGGLVFAPAGG